MKQEQKSLLETLLEAYQNWETTDVPLFDEENTSNNLAITRDRVDKSSDNDSKQLLKQRIESAIQASQQWHPTSGTHPLLGLLKELNVEKEMEKGWLRLELFGRKSGKNSEDEVDFLAKLGHCVSCGQRRELLLVLVEAWGASRATLNVILPQGRDENPNNETKMEDAMVVDWLVQQFPSSIRNSLKELDYGTLAALLSHIEEAKNKSLSMPTMTAPQQAPAPVSTKETAVSTTTKCPKRFTSLAAAITATMPSNMPTIDTTSPSAVVCTPPIAQLTCEQYQMATTNPRVHLPKGTVLYQIDDGENKGTTLYFCCMKGYYPVLLKQGFVTVVPTTHVLLPAWGGDQQI